MSTPDRTSPEDVLELLVSALNECDDPEQLYQQASALRAQLETAAQQVTAAKARALTALWKDGSSYGVIAELPWVEETRSGVQKLVERGRGLPKSPIEMYEASGKSLADAPPRTQEILRLAEESHNQQKESQ